MSTLPRSAVDAPASTPFSRRQPRRFPSRTLSHPPKLRPNLSSHASQRHLDLPLYDAASNEMLCAHRQELMDLRGDHAPICKRGFGVVHRHNALRNAIARSVVEEVGIRYNLEHTVLVEGGNFRPADIRAQPPTLPHWASPGKRTAYNVTVSRPFSVTCILAASSRTAGAVELASTPKESILQSQLQAAGVTPADWDFVPLARFRHFGRTLAGCYQIY